MSDAPRYWFVLARRIVTRNGWRSSEGVPAFVLDSWQQGITTAEHAERVARAVLHPREDEELSISVAPVLEHA